MPGTILVSVLEFMDLPLSSSTSIRASMGKIEYQITDKGDFSFPLTSLRDDLILKIQDDEGNEISRSGVQIRLILQKGVWEDIFPLGEGHLNLKLQVILNDKERDRIRMMRESALKKKHDELLSSNRRGAESDTSTVVGNAGLPFRTNDEVSELPKGHLQHEAASQLKSPVGICDDKEPGTRNVVGAMLDQQQLNQNIADRYNETSSTKPVSQAVNLTQIQHKGKKPANQSPSEKQPQRIGSSKDMAILLSSERVDALTKNLSEPNLREYGLQYSEKKSTLGRTPSNVRKMISAFEGGLPKDMKSHIKPPPTKYQASTTDTEETSKARHSEIDKSWNTKPENFLEEGEKSSSLVRNMQKAPVHFGESRDHMKQLNNVSPEETQQLKELSTIKTLNKQTVSNDRKRFKVSYNTDKEEEKSDKVLMRTSAFETVTMSGTMPEKHSPQKLDSVAHFGDKYHSFESSGVWIFPEEPKKICITTSSKNVMDRVESQATKRLSHQRSLESSKIENIEKKF
ncbi:uncharacterized protein LOC130726849 isoform X2 [Lotus japonicus]|uniref:uncharacterized protein LOC130726849 isoform X2 n=1 Tax=Lotus japonicus TaxID=34305 RepID=UPI002584BE0F|nr:uncharacterized protein LOC130726849 isoform X2 [Lotus japonicus]